MNTIDQFEQQQMKMLAEKNNIPEFGPGDTIRVNVNIKEGSRERIQGYEGVCIAKGGKGLSQSFTVRKISYGEGVERLFPLFSPRIESIVLIRRGDVRRSKLYYLRGLSGKASRIRERTTGHGIDKDTKSTKKKATAKTVTKEKKSKEKKVASAG